MKPIKVVLINQGELTGTGYTWEYFLASRGWNKLPEEKKFGLVAKQIDMYTYRIYFPHVEPPISLTLFIDEFRRK